MKLKRKTLKEKIAVMQHFEDGGKVEWVDSGFDDDWTEFDGVGWNWTEFDYRIIEREISKEDKEWLYEHNIKAFKGLI